MNTGKESKQKGRPKKSNDKAPYKNTKFCENLNKLFGKQKESQETVAKALNTTRQTVGNWLAGRNQPDYEMLVSIANYYNVSCDYLLGISELKSPNPDDVNFHELTGLTDNALLTLEQAKNDEYTLKAMNTILGCDCFARIINNFANMIEVHKQNVEDNSKYKFEMNIVQDMEDLRREVIEEMTGIKYK